MKAIEYRVRPVVRYNLTRFESEEHANGLCSGGCESIGTFDREDAAYRIAEALSVRDGGTVHIPAEPYQPSERDNGI